MENFVFPNKIKTKLMKTSKLMSVFSYLNLNFQRSFPHDFNYANFGNYVVGWWYGKLTTSYSRYSKHPGIGSFDIIGKRCPGLL